MTARPFALSDRALWLAIGGALFALSAWPLLLVELPPLQDLPNHIASAYIAQHLDRYPDYVFNGVAKSNSLLELWLHLFGDHLLCGGRAFVALAIAANAFGLPWFVLQLAGRRSMVNASLFLWPLVHGFCLAMGMLNFAVAVPASLVLLVLLARQRVAPRLARTVAIAVLSIAVWFIHPFPLIIVGALATVESAAQRSWPERIQVARAVVMPLAPIAALVAGTALHHLVKPAGSPATTSDIAFLTPWELVAHFWLDASGALTRWGSATAIPALLLPLFAWRGRPDAPPLVGNRAIAALVLGYVGLPLMLSNWWYLNTRVVPFLWLALAIRVPRTLPRSAVAALAASALAFSIALGVDYTRLDRDREAFTAGIAAVPERATLLPLLFAHRKTSDFTASLTHAWAYYLLAKHTSAPLVFAVERSYSITYRTYPPPEVIPPALDRFAELHATPAQSCALERSIGRNLADCTARWQLLWSQFWRIAEPRFTHVLTWAMPSEARAVLPESYRAVFTAGELAIYARAPTTISSP